jgi:cytidyltransferase-like protein
MSKSKAIGYMSGTFDLFHIGHLNIIRSARSMCDELIVGVHRSGTWKGKDTFIPFDERLEIVKAIRFVDRVIQSYTEDADAWGEIGFHKLFVGSDYTGSDRFKKYEAYFSNKNVQIVYLPYTSHTSSTILRQVISNSISDHARSDR